MKIMSKLFILAVIILTLPGCYGKSEIDDLAYVIAIGADYIEGTENGEIEITYQVALPVKITGEGNDTGKSTFTTYSTIAPSLDKASSNINAISSKRIDLSHISLILYSKELSEKGIDGHINSLVTNVSIRPRTIVAVCEGKAKDYLENVTPILETSPARYYELLISSFKYSSKTIGTEILDFYSVAHSICQDPIITMTHLNEKNEAVFEKIAVFKNLKLIGEINEEESLGHLILTNNLGEGIISLKDVLDEKSNVTILLKESRPSKLKVTISNGIPYVTIETYIDAHLNSNGGNTDYYDEDNKEKLKELIKTKIRENISQYLEKTIELNSDTSGIGKYAKANYLTYKEFEELNWKEIYKNLKYDIKANVNVNVSKIISSSIPYSKN